MIFSRYSIEKCLEKGPGPRPTLNKLLAAMRSLQVAPSAATAAQQPAAKPQKAKKSLASKKTAEPAAASGSGTLPFVLVGIAVVALAAVLVVFRETILAWMQG